MEYHIMLSQFTNKNEKQCYDKVGLMTKKAMFSRTNILKPRKIHFVYGHILKKKKKQGMRKEISRNHLANL